MEWGNVEWMRLAQSGTAVNTVMKLQVQYNGAERFSSCTTVSSCACQLS